MKWKLLLVGVVLITLLVNCQRIFNKNKSITITKEYIQNPNFDEFHKTFGIHRLRLKDGVDITKVNTNNIKGNKFPLDSFEVDSTFGYYGGIYPWDDSWKERKVYFNKFNDSVFWRRTKLSNRDSIIGDLENDTWYRFHGVYSENVYSLICYVNDTGGGKKYFISFR